MEVNPILFWNGLLTLVIAPAIWVFRGMFMEVKRLDILLNKTREEYAKRDDVKEDMHTVMDALKRLEDKLDKILQPLHSAMFIESNPSPVKYAASLLGMCDPDVRLPLVQVKEENKKKISEALKVAKIL